MHRRAPDEIDPWIAFGPAVFVRRPTTVSTSTSPRPANGYTEVEVGRGASCCGSLLWIRAATTSGSGEGGRMSRDICCTMSRDFTMVAGAGFEPATSGL